MQESERQIVDSRRAMLERVHRIWIKGALERSLNDTPLFRLGMEECVDAVARPRSAPTSPQRPARFPSGTEISEVFHRMNESLLILGRPGVGKTTTLLALAWDALRRTARDLSKPLPVVFSLAAWDKKCAAFDAWLIARLQQVYRVPQSLAQAWVEREALLLLLDGLDEAEKQQPRLVKALNAFHRAYRFTPLAVCSRVDVYETLETPLDLYSAVLLRPFTSRQVDRYVEGTSIERRAARLTLRHDKALRDFAKTPLVLNTMLLAYRGASPDVLHKLRTAEARRAHVLAAYVERVFERKFQDSVYAQPNVLRWLSALAYAMRKHDRDTFFIERLQPSWLGSWGLRYMYVFFSRMLGGLSIGVVVGIFYLVYFRFDPEAMEVDALMQKALHLFRFFRAVLYGPIDGLVGGALVGLLDMWRLEQQRDPQNMSKFVRLRSTASGYIQIIAALVICLPVLNGLLKAGGSVFLAWRAGYKQLGCFARSFRQGVSMILTAMLMFYSPAFGVFLRLRSHSRAILQEIRLPECLHLSMRSGIKGLFRGLAVVFFHGFSVWVVASILTFLLGLFSEASLRGLWGFGEGIVFVLAFGVGLGLVGAVLGGFLGMFKREPLETRTFPQEGVTLSWNNVLLLVASGFLLGGLLMVPFGITIDIPAAGLIVGGSLGLWYGLDLLYHYVLRLVAWLNGDAPWELARFLDNVAGRAFLRKDGAGYAFIHPVVQDYFASLYTTDLTEDVNIEDPGELRRQFTPEV